MLNEILSVAIKFSPWLPVRSFRSWLMWRWMNWNPRRAKQNFRELRESLDGIREQAAVDGKVNKAARANLVERLEWLDIWPRSIRGVRAEELVSAEADYLHRCTRSNYGIELARQKFPKEGPQEWKCRTDSQGEFMGDEYRHDQLAWHWQRLKEKGTQEVAE